MEFSQTLGPVGIPPECTKCEQYLPPDWAESICNDCTINESAAEAMKQYEDEQKKIVKEQVHHRLSNNKWAKENDRKNMNKLRYEIKAAEAKLAFENRLCQNPRVPQSTTGAAATPQNCRFDFPLSSGASGSFTSSRDRSGFLSSMPAGVYRTISNSVAPSHVAPHSVPRRLTREESVGPGNKVSRTGRIRQVGFLMEDQIPRHPVSSLGPPPPRIPQNSGNKHRTKRTAHAHIDDEGDLSEIPPRSIKRSTDSREQAGVPQRQDRHQGSAASYHNLVNRSRDHRSPQLTQCRNSLYETATNHQSRTPADQRHAHDNADMTELSLDDHYPAATTRSARRLQLNRVGCLVDTDDKSTTEPEIARNLRPRNKSRTSQPMASVTSKRTGDSISARAPKSKRKKIVEEPEPVPRQPGRLHFNNSSASALDHLDEAAAPYKSDPATKTWAVPKDVVGKAKFATYITGMDRSSAPNEFDDAPDAVPDDDSALLDGSDSDAHSGSHMSQVTVPLTEKMSMWHVKPAISDSVPALQVEKQRKRMSSFVMPETSASDEEESRMVTEWEIGLVKNKRVQKKVKIVQIAVVIPSHVPGGSVARTSAAFDVEDSDDDGDDGDDDDVGDARFYGGEAQVDPLRFLRELPQKLKDGTLKPSTLPRPKMSPAVAKHYTPTSDDVESPNMVRKLFAIPKKAIEKKQEMVAQDDMERPSEMQQSSHNVDDKARGNAKNSDVEENGQKGELSDASAARETQEQGVQALANILNYPLPKPNSGMKEPVPQQSTENGPLIQADPLEEDFPDMQMDYPEQNEDMENNPAMDLLKTMDKQVNVIEDADVSNSAYEKKTEMQLGTPKPKTISAKMLQEMEGLPARSPINDALMLDVGARTMGDSTSKEAASCEKKKSAEDLQSEIAMQDMLWELETRKAKYEKEKSELMIVFKEGGDFERQMMVAELHAKKLDAFMEENGLEFEREKLWFE